ncbi:MAG: hypothetical protein IKZ58_06605 [Selenomonadaceae bacterium]|nr:hypothetical protein [Selenomonadaceae bacterium]
MPRIFNPDGTFEDVDHVNFYLLNGSDIFVKSRSTPLCPVPKIVTGNRPADGGNLILSEDEKNYFIEKYPQDKKFIRTLIGGEEFLHNKKRYCLWLVDATPDEIKRNKFIYERVKKCKEDRLKGAADRQKLADTPHLFRETFVPSNAIVIPVVSSEKRKYIPMAYIDNQVICTDRVKLIPNAEIWHFGILTSSVHMIWMRAVCGRLESRYNYSVKIVYNNFAWMNMEFGDYAELILAAGKILKARKNYPDASLADLYDEVTMPKDLRAAHREVDKIVMRIYGYDESWSEEEIAIDLLKRYEFLSNYVDEHKHDKKISDDDDEE